MEQTQRKQRMLSLIQPSGVPTLGNYLGAMKYWPDLQEEYDTAFAVADLHAITVRQDPKVLKQKTLDLYALMLAAGLDPEKGLVFIQSHVPTHAQLSWVLSCYTQFGELSRMTQFKDKSAQHADNVNVGLFSYPVLMAADILLYQADYVPVGADQKQHLELTRDIAGRFNGRYGNVFTMPEPYIQKAGARIMSLQEPQKKMSKSDSNANGYISLLDEPEVNVQKFKRAVTDSETEICYREGKDGINNLMENYACVTGLDYAAIERDFSGKGYGEFKQAVGEAVAEELRPLQERYARLRADQAYLEDCCRKGGELALRVSQRTLDKVMKKIGFLLP
ncbi:MAG: tryptophan--tRNA ligase [Clostridiales bacterium]|nr:tryptophan--tRNA ligase [Clostridiales bacterium]